MNNNGTVRFTSSSAPSAFEYKGGTIAGNAIELSFASLTLGEGASPATFRFINGNNDHNGNILAGQIIIIDAATGGTNARRGNSVAGDFSFCSAGTIRLTGADVNDPAAFNLFGGDSVLTHTGVLHVVGVPGSSNLRIIGGTNGGSNRQRRPDQCRSRYTTQHQYRGHQHGHDQYRRRCNAGYRWHQQ